MKPLFSILYTILFLLSATSYAQKTELNIDSLYTATSATKDSPKKVDTFIYLYKKSIKQHAIRKDILEEALAISKKIFYIKGIGICYNRKGITARYDQDFSASVTYHKRALSFLEQTTDTLYIAKCLNSLGVTYRKLNLEKEAFESYFKSLKLAEKIDNKRGVTIALNGMGNVFLNIEQYDNALFYLKKALTIETEIKNPKGQEYGFANVGEVFLHKKVYDSAYYYFNKSLQLSLKNPRKESVAIKYILFGLLHQKKKNYTTSIDFYKKAIPKLTTFKNIRYLSNAFINIGINQIQLKQYNKAFSNISDGLEKAKSIKSKENISLGYKALTSYYTATKNYKKALIAQKTSTVFHDSIVNIASQKNIISTQIAYETLQKDKQIRLLAKEKSTSEAKAKTNYSRFIFSLLASVLIIGVLLFALILSRKNKELALEQKNTELQNYLLQIDELKTKTNAHKKLSTQDLLKRFDQFELSKREIEVLTHISNGLSNSEIATKMFISNNTIKTHITHIYSKLDVKNRVQAIRKISS